MNRTGRQAVKLIGFFLATGACIALAQQQGGFLSNFTGEISIVNSEEMRSSRIRFEAGARTNWHVHSEPQLLLIEEGQGRWQEEGGRVNLIEAGAPVLTRGAVSHWHGAAPDQAAVQFSVYSGTLEWQDPVTDDQYLGR
ncbi:MAG TPA: cupin domain-containing protein [Gammaproteobacteria bacterium]|jgi:quercetin dioxygenase-like cupin family protein